jgi:hypothetical protein
MSSDLLEIKERSQISNLLYGKADVSPAMETNIVIRRSYATNSSFTLVTIDRSLFVLLS